ncbi:hypothetical protein L9F63_012677, partial [Diploptera punctata]
LYIYITRMSGYSIQQQCSQPRAVVIITATPAVKVYVNTSVFIILAASRYSI